MDGPMKRPHMGLIYVMCLLPWVVFWSFNHDDLERSGDATVSSRGFLRPTPVLGSVYDIS